MKQPNYIAIRIPATVKDFSTTKIKDFNKLEGKIVTLNFAERRNRKDFNYTVEKAVIERWIYAKDGKTKDYNYLLRLRKN